MTRRLLDNVVLDVHVSDDGANRARTLIDSEWLVTNGLGGYASSSLSCRNTRRYHGLLIAALANPVGRLVMLSHINETVVLSDGQRVDLSTGEVISAFRMEAGLPVWEFDCGPSRIEKRLLMPHGQNTVHVTYQLLSGDGVALEVRPSMHFRGYEEAVTTIDHANYVLSESSGDQCVRGREDHPSLRMHVSGGQPRFSAEAAIDKELDYPVEQARGYAFQGTAWSPGCYTARLEREQLVTFMASAEKPEVFHAMTPDDVRACEIERRRRLAKLANETVQDPIGLELVLAADQFIITPAGRIADSTRARATGDEVRTIIAGYHWFTDWGRDTMISLEGLTLATGRHREAAFILRTFAHYVRDGLIPNFFPDGDNQGVYHTADATLWFFHALERYRRLTEDHDLLTELLPVMQRILEAHEHGTRFGIGMDPDDGLLHQGAEGYQLTWMDAKVDGWVVTPRRGKAVEINALWYNALCLMESWLELMRGSGAGSYYRQLCTRVRDSFNARFWNAELGYLFDVVDGESGDSPECRPNQLIAISADHPVLAREHWESVMDAVRSKLLTPVGLRSLAPGEPDYKARYFGDLRARDAAYHQGTVWAWLIGPWIDARLKLHPQDVVGARKDLDGLIKHLSDFGVGSIAEIFDATEPFTPRGCIAQAWSVAEVLRCWGKTATR